MIGSANAEPIATIFEEGSRVDRTMRLAGQYLSNVTTSNFGAVLSQIDFKKYICKNGTPLRTIHHKGFF